MTNLIELRNSKGSDRWNGYRCFRLYHDHAGELHPYGAKYVVFRNGYLVGEYTCQTDADLSFLQGNVDKGLIRLNEYLGIDERLRK